MPNPNYNAGRRLEYKVKKQWEKDGFTVFRTAGSHGSVDLIAVQPNDISFIQCKRCQTMAQANKLERQLKSKLPLPSSDWYTQYLEVYVAERRSQYKYILD